MTIPELIGPYEILEKLGQGGMGVVYKARDRRLRRFVALKFLLDGLQDEKLKLRFLREAQAASALNHANIVSIHDIGEHESSAYIVMEYVAGHPLRQLIPPGGFGREQALAYALGIAEGVAAAHGAGIVHRDLKPANVIVTTQGGIKVLDFGLARIDSEPSVSDGPHMEMTAPGMFVGTAAYVAPEQSLGRRVDHRADIFSFGVILQELLTGQRPFRGETVIELLYDINKGTPRSVRELRPELPEALEAVVFRMLAKDPATRYQSMEAVIAALKSLGSESEEATRLMEITPVPAGPPVPGSEKAYIAVLQFRSLSADKEDEYLAAGISSEVVRALSGVPGLRVASELTAFRFGKEGPDLAGLAKQLGLRYVLTGSLRRAGNRIRVIAELSDAPNETLIWSQTYNRAIEDVFAVQEEIAEAIVGATGGQIIRTRSEQASRESAENLDAWGLVNKANHVVNHAWHFEAIDSAVELLRRATAIAPDYAAAHSFLGLYLMQRVIGGHTKDAPHDRAEALAAVGEALRIAPVDPEVLQNAGLVYFNCGKTDQARRALRRGVEKAPFNLVAWGYLGLCLGWTGDAKEMKEARVILDRLTANAPDHPSLPYWLYFKAGLCAREADYEAAAEYAGRSAELQPQFPPVLLEWANALACSGRTEEAWTAAREAFALNPGGTQREYVEELLTTTGSEERARPHIQGLIAAGIFTEL